MQGHSPGGISKISFSAKDRVILTSGKYDRSLFQWKIEKSKISHDPIISFRPSTQMTRFDSIASRVEKDYIPTIITDESLIINGVNFAKQSISTLPDIEVQSISSLGMSCTSFSRQITHLPLGLYCGSGDILTVVGALPVSINANRNGQSHWQVPRNEYGYLNDIGFITLTSDARIVVLCEKAPASLSPNIASEKFYGRIFSYNSSTGILLSEFPNKILGGIVSASFSADNKTLGCLGCDQHHSLTIYNSVTGDWTDPNLLYTGQVDLNPITLITSILQSRSNMEFQFVTGGRGRLRFWKLRGRNAISSACESDITDAITAMVSIDPGQVITGDSNGNISLWDGKSCLQIMSNCHSKRISALCKYDTTITNKQYGTYGFISASCDVIKIWSNTLEQLQELVITDLLFRINRVTDSAYVTTMCTDSIFKRLLLTLSNSLILEVSVDSGAVLLVTEGHISGSFVALASHPKDTRILVTGGYDGWLKCWDIRCQAALEVMYINEPINYIVFHKEGNILAIALKDTILILEFNILSSIKFNIIYKLNKICSEKITMLRYSPNHSVLAAGSSDNYIYLFDVNNKYSKLTQLKGHSKSIEGFDFSSNGKYLRSFSRSSDDETRVHTIFHYMEIGSLETYEQVTDINDLTIVSTVDWVSISSASTPEGRGIKETENQLNASQQNVIAKNIVISNDGKLLAVGYSDGNVRLFRNPACSINSQGIDLCGHAKGVVSCAFSADGQYLYTAGSMDGSVIVWSITSTTTTSKKPKIIGKMSSFDL